MRSPVFVRNFEAVLRELARRGHSVHVAFEGDKEGQDGQHGLIAELVREHPALTVGQAPAAPRVRAAAAGRLRGTADYLRYLGPRYARAGALRARARRHALPGTAALAPLLRRAPRVRRAVAAAASALARLGPPPRRLQRFLRARGTGVLLLSPLTHFGSPQPDYVRAARRLGIGSALVLFSWDNLTNKGLMHEVPDRVLVWNDLQAREAVEHHGVAPGRVEVTGAPAYDHWFAWGPSRDRGSFLAELGLDPAQPTILYLCSSGFIAAEEPAWVARWLDALRAQGGALSRANVVVRPHPLNAGGWRSQPLGDRAGVVVFPALGEDPTSEAARRSYYDSIHHAALVVGINTTALVESAIIGRRSFTLRSAQFAQTQDGTLHFHQLREDQGGPLRVADSMAEHLAQLADGLRRAPEERGQLQRFVASFVRPRGVEAAVAPIVADRIEALAREVRRR
ncbi:MAG TPA: hypothetical protein VMY78_14400 [Solirubrobacteraceae bacterium]|nr:hypothetical protein [Solirubrobacteraceae bacterium]